MNSVSDNSHLVSVMPLCDRWSGMFFPCSACLCSKWALLLLVLLPLLSFIFFTAPSPPASVRLFLQFFFAFIQSACLTVPRKVSLAPNCFAHLRSFGESLTSIQQFFVAFIFNTPKRTINRLSRLLSLFTNCVSYARSSHLSSSLLPSLSPPLSSLPPLHTGCFFPKWGHSPCDSRLARSLPYRLVRPARPGRWKRRRGRLPFPPPSPPLFPPWLLLWLDHLSARGRPGWERRWSFHHLQLPAAFPFWPPPYSPRTPYNAMLS